MTGYSSSKLNSLPAESRRASTTRRSCMSLGSRRSPSELSSKGSTQGFISSLIDPLRTSSEPSGFENVRCSIIDGQTPRQRLQSRAQQAGQGIRTEPVTSTTRYAAPVQLSLHAFTASIYTDYLDRPVGVVKG